MTSSEYTPDQATKLRALFPDLATDPGMLDAETIADARICRQTGDLFIYTEDYNLLISKQGGDIMSEAQLEHLDTLIAIQAVDHRAVQEILQPKVTCTPRSAEAAVTKEQYLLLGEKLGIDRSMSEALISFGPIFSNAKKPS